MKIIKYKYFYSHRDHYLAPGHELKASFESGFSSSYNQTGNSNEAQYRSSQELFSQSERNDFQLGVSAFSAKNA